MFSHFIKQCIWFAYWFVCVDALRPCQQYFTLVSVLSSDLNSGLQIRVRIGELFSLFVIQNICCGYSKEPSQ